MPNLLSRNPLEFPKKGAEVYAVLDGKDYRVKLGDILKLLTAADLGLDKVENTADLDKPISKAVQTALDRKAAKTDLEDLVTIAQVNEAIREALRNHNPQGGDQAGQPGVSEDRITEIINNFWNTQIAEGGVIKLIQTDVADAKSALAALTETVQGHTGKITQSEEDVTTLKNKVAGIEESLKVPGNPDQSAGVTANTAAIAKLGERVTAVEGLAERVQAVETTANAAATAEAVQTLTGRVEATEGVANAAATKVDHDALAQRVQALEGAENTGPGQAAFQQVQNDVQALKTKTEGLENWGEFKQQYDQHVSGMSDYLQTSQFSAQLQTELPNIREFTQLSSKVTALEEAKGTVDQHAQTIQQLQETLQQLQQKVQELEGRVGAGGVGG